MRLQQRTENIRYKKTCSPRYYGVPYKINKHIIPQTALLSSSHMNSYLSSLLIAGLLSNIVLSRPQGFLGPLSPPEEQDPSEEGSTIPQIFFPGLAGCVLTLDTSILTADCSSVTSTVDLNSCVANVGGAAVYQPRYFSISIV
jgi:hypothetical protein